MLFDNSFTYWFYAGIFYLAWLTYQDYKHNRMVDDRFNYLMFGVTYSLLSHARVNLLFLMSTITMATFLLIFLGKIKALGAADNKTLTWIFTGLSIISISMLAWYMAIFAACLSFVLLMKKYVFKYQPPVPFYPVFFITFLSIMVLYRQY